MYKKSVAETYNKTASKLSYIIFAIGILPLFFIFIIYINNADSPVLNAIANETSNIPAWTSASSPLLTKVMDVYCKTAPVLAVFSLFFSVKIVLHNKINDSRVLLRSCLVYPFIYFPFIYFLMFSNRELTTSGGVVRLMSTNDYSLLFVYIGIYLAVLMMTCGLYILPVIAYRLVKERR